MIRLDWTTRTLDTTWTSPDYSKILPLARLATSNLEIMAPFARGRGFSRGSQGFHARGGSRGRGSGNVRAHGNRKATFISSRVEEPVEHEPDMNDESQGLKVGENESAAEDLSSESDQDIAASTNVKPYNMLLQSLNANIQRGQPERKKRKIENTGALENNEDLDQNLDLVEEPEEAEFADLSDAEDDDEPDDTDNSKFPRLYVHSLSKFSR